MLLVNDDVVVAYVPQKPTGESPCIKHSELPHYRDRPVPYKEGEAVKDFMMCGMGCVLIKRQVLEEMEFPYFRYSSQEYDISNYWSVCVLPQQLVYTEIPKNVEEVKVGDKILGSNGKYQNVISTTSRDWDGKILRIVPKNMRLPIEVTPEHRIPIYRNGRMMLLQAKKINPETDLLFTPILGEINDVNSISLSYSLNDVRNDYRKSLPNELIVDDAFMEFLGKYVSDGSVSHSDKNNRNVKTSISLAFNHQTEMKQMNYYGEYLTKLLNRKFNIFISKRAPDSERYSAMVKGGCTPLARLLKEWFGDGARNKYIHRWILELPHKKLAAFLKGIWEGDGFETYAGDYKHPILAVGVSSERLVTGIGLILLKFGIKYYVEEFYQHKDSYGAGNKHWRIVVSGDRDKLFEILTGKHENTRKQVHNVSYIKDSKFLYKIDRIEKRSYKGKVYDIGTDGDHTFLLRGIASHNSEDYYFFLKLDEMGIKPVFLSDAKVRHITQAALTDTGLVNI